MDEKTNRKRVTDLTVQLSEEPKEKIAIDYEKLRKEIDTHKSISFVEPPSHVNIDIT